MKVTTARDSGAKMINMSINVAEGPHKGARLVDRFVFPTAEKPQKFGLSRFHAFLLALGAKVKEAAFQFDLDQCKNRILYCDVVDQDREASESADGKKYAATTVSVPQSYYSRREVEDAEKKRLEQLNGATPAAAAVEATMPAPAQAPAAEAPQAVQTPPPAPTPAPAAPVAQPAAAPAAVAVAVADPPAAAPQGGVTVEEAVDDFFK